MLANARTPRDPAGGDGTAGGRGDRDNAAAGPRHPASRRAGQRPGVRQSRDRHAAAADADAIPRSEREQRRRGVGAGAIRFSNRSTSAASPPRRCSARRKACRCSRTACASTKPFGDVVNWDLLPPSAISSVQLIPGSASAFGLNTLGGALAIYTKSGAQYPGGVGRDVGRLVWTQGMPCSSTAARSDRVRLFRHRTISPTTAAGPITMRAASEQFFGKVGYQDDVTDLDVSATLADNTLEGAQTLPLSMLDNPETVVHVSRPATTTGSRSSMPRAAAS